MLVRNIACATTITLFSACTTLEKFNDNIENISVTAESIIQDAIANIDTNSAQWQNIVKTTVDKLDQRFHDTALEVNGILQNGISASGVELKCSVDFLSDRIKQHLAVILAKLKNQKTPVITPVICNTTPSAVNTKDVPSPIDRIEVYGYDFAVDGSNVQAKLVSNKMGNRNINQALNFPSHYHFTLKFGPNGTVLNDYSDKIEFSSGATLLSSVGVIQPPIPKCLIKNVTYNIPPITYIPPKTRGDSEFDGHGPDVDLLVRMETKTHASQINKIRFFIQMEAQETKRDWTTAKGSKRYDVITVEPGFRLWQRLAPTKNVSTLSYRDRSKSDDILHPGEGPVHHFVVVGDTKGKDIGRTKVTTHFKPIQYQIKQQRNCNG